MSSPDSQLAACLRAWPAAPACPPDLSIPGFWRRCARAGVVRLVARQLGLSRAEEPPESRVVEARSIRCVGATRRVARALQAAALPFALLKGPALAERLYGDASLRPTTDVDVLVDPANLDAALAALDGIGARPPPGWTERDLARERRWGHQTVRMLDGFPVEVHMRASERFGGRMEAGPLLARAVEVPVLGTRLPVLSLPDELAYLATHAAAHFLTKEVLLLDLHAFLLRHPLSLASVRQRSVELGVRRPVAVALTAAAALTALPASRLPLRMRLEGAWARGLASGEGVEDGSEELSQAVRMLATDAAWSDGPTHVARHLGGKAALVLARRLAP